MGEETIIVRTSAIEEQSEDVYYPGSEFQSHTVEKLLIEIVAALKKLDGSMIKMEQAIVEMRDHGVKLKLR